MFWLLKNAFRLFVGFLRGGNSVWFSKNEAGDVYCCIPYIKINSQQFPVFCAKWKVSFFVFLDVYGFYSHGAPSQEAESGQSWKGTGAGERHGQHERPERPRPPEEREEMLLRRRAVIRDTVWVIIPGLTWWIHSLQHWPHVHAPEDLKEHSGVFFKGFSGFWCIKLYLYWRWTFLRTAVIVPLSSALIDSQMFEEI